MRLLIILAFLAFAVSVFYAILSNSYIERTYFQAAVPPYSLYYNYYWPSVSNVVSQQMLWKGNPSDSLDNYYVMNNLLARNTLSQERLQMWDDERLKWNWRRNAILAAYLSP